MKYRLISLGRTLLLSLVVCFSTLDAGEPPKRAPQLVIAQLGNPTALDGWNWAATSEQDILGHIQETLVEYDRQAKLHPLLADRLEMKTPAEWIVTIRKGVKFHEPALGELTAEDVKASIEANLRKGTAMSLRVPAPMREGTLEVIDAHTLRWKLKEPGLVTLPQWLVDEYITSKKYLEREGYDGAARRPVGTGPYTFVEWSPNQRVVMEVFAGYWRPLPAFDRLIWRIIPDPSTRKNEFLTGGIDVLPFVTPEIVPEIQANPKLRLETTLSTRMMFIVLPVANPLLTDKRVRLALNLAVNKGEIIEQLFRGIGAAELTAPLPLTVAERHPKLEGYPYDPAKAEQLLKEAGVVGKTLTLEAPYNRYTLDREIGEAIAGYWEAVGLRVEYKPQDFAVFSPRVLRGSPEWPTNPFLIGFGDGRYLADYMYTLWIEKKPGGSRGAVYTKGPDRWDEWMREISLLGLQEPRRLELLYKLQEEIMDFVPWVLVLNYKDIYGLSSKVDWKPFPNENRKMYDAKPR
ncbi:MAG TPA: ABC transporter substrate-binding protein [Alphaproteobacteria bacterium]|nr:ABC transporter substrate-binding protein [Alphaproteobacteria bacterium]